MADQEQDIEARRRAAEADYYDGIFRIPPGAKGESSDG